MSILTNEHRVSGKIKWHTSVFMLCSILLFGFVSGAVFYALHSVQKSDLQLNQTVFEIEDSHENQTAIIMVRVSNNTDSKQVIVGAQVPCGVSVRTELPCEIPAHTMRELEFDVGPIDEMCGTAAVLYATCGITNQGTISFRAPTRN